MNGGSWNDEKQTGVDETMAKIQEAGKAGEGNGKYFSSKDIVGQPFQIEEDVNASSDFRETTPKEGAKPGRDGKPIVWLCIEISSNGETKDLHLTNSALRALRDSMPPGIATWKGQRAVMNNDAKGFIPAKFTRLMGDYEAVLGQAQLGQTPAGALHSSEKNPYSPAKSPEQFPQAPETLDQKKARFLAGLGTSPGVHDSRIMDTAAAVFGDYGTAEFIFGMLKQSGQVRQTEGGQWVRT